MNRKMTDFARGAKCGTRGGKRIERINHRLAPALRRARLRLQHRLERHNAESGPKPIEGNCDVRGRLGNGGGHHCVIVRGIHCCSAYGGKIPKATPPPACNRGGFGWRVCAASACLVETIELDQQGSPCVWNIGVLWIGRIRRFGKRIKAASTWPFFFCRINPRLYQARA